MSTTANLSLNEVDQRLDTLQYNLRVLLRAAETLAGTAENPLPFVSLTQAFHEDAEELRVARNGSPDDRYAALDHTLSNLGTIREEADADAIAALDKETEGRLRKWT